MNELFWVEKKGEGEGWSVVREPGDVIDLMFKEIHIYTLDRVLMDLNNPPCKKLPVTPSKPDVPSKWCISVPDNRLLIHKGSIFWHDGEEIVTYHPDTPRLYLTEDELVRFVERRRDFSHSTRDQDTDESDDDEDDDDDTDHSGWLVRDSESEGEEESDSDGSSTSTHDSEMKRLIKESERVRERERREAKREKKKKRRLVMDDDDSVICIE